MVLPGNEFGVPPSELSQRLDAYEGISTADVLHLPEWQTPETEALKQDITVRHLLTMSSGLEWDESDYYSEDAVNDAFEMGAFGDYIQYVLAKPVVNEPGTAWNYSSGDSMLLSGVVEYVTGARAYDLALEAKDAALFWVFVTEWLVVTASGLICGAVVWTLMVRRRLYREVTVTRLERDSRL